MDVTAAPSVEGATPLRPGTPQENCGICMHFDPEAGFCNILAIPTTPEMLSDQFTPKDGGDQESLEDMLFGGPGG